MSTRAVAVSTVHVFNILSVSSGKNRRLKQAKEEAQAEIEQYRLQREKEFKTKEAAVCLRHHDLLFIGRLYNKTSNIYLLKNIFNFASWFQTQPPSCLSSGLITATLLWSRDTFRNCVDLFWIL